MASIDSIISDSERKLKKALQRFQYSYRKVKALPLPTADLDDEILEVWEGFASRFGRAADLFLTRYLRSIVLRQDPGFRGSLRDFLDQAEKLGKISSAEDWLEVRELRNRSAHEYEEDELAGYFQKLLIKAPLILGILSHL